MTAPTSEPAARLIHPSGRRSDFVQFLAIGVSLVIACLILPPVFVLVQNSLFLTNPDGSHGALTFENFSKLFQEGDILRSGWNSLEFAILTTFFSLILGGSLAWIVERTDAPFRGLAFFMSVVSLGIPLIIYVPAWLSFLGPIGPINQIYRALSGNSGNLLNINSIGGMVLIETLGWLPLSFLLFAANFRAANAELEEAARMSGASVPAMIWRISIPLAAPTVFAVGLFILINALQSFDVPKLVGTSANIKLLTTDIYDSIRAAVPPKVGLASAYSVVLSVGVAGLMYFYNRVSRNASRFATVTGKGYRSRLLPLGRYRWLGGVFIIGTVAVVLGIPLLSLFWIALSPFSQPMSLSALSSLTFENFAIVLGSSDYLKLVLNTVISAGAAATITMVLMVLCGWLVARRRRFHFIIDQMVAMPMLLPGIVLSVAMMDVALRSPIPLYSTLSIIILAFVVHYMPYGMRYTFGGVIQIHKELEESAGISGASLPMILRRIVVPLLWPAILAGWIFIFLNASRDLSTAIILAGPETKTIAVAIFDQAANGEFSEVAALGLLWSFLMSSVALIFYVIMRRRGGSLLGF